MPCNDLIHIFKWFIVAYKKYNYAPKKLNNIVIDT